MNLNFSSLSVNDKSYVGEGNFYQSGKDLLIDLDSKILLNQFKKLMKTRERIKSISFYSVEEREYHYAGDFIITRIVGNEVTLYKA